MVLGGQGALVCSCEWMVMPLWVECIEKLIHISIQFYPKAIQQQTDTSVYCIRFKSGEWGWSDFLQRFILTQTETSVLTHVYISLKYVWWWVQWREKMHLFILLCIVKMFNSYSKEIWMPAFYRIRRLCIQIRGRKMYLWQLNMEDVILTANVAVT